MTETPEIHTTEETVRCAGWNASLGHPAVYLNFSGQLQLQCPYCSQIFKRDVPPQEPETTETPAEKKVSPKKTAPKKKTAESKSNAKVKKQT